MLRIGVAYRRADSGATVDRILDRLTAHYGREMIFLDIDDIPAGLDVRQHLDEMMLKTGILLAIVGPEWLDMQNGGIARINKESDFVRNELEAALR